MECDISIELMRIREFDGSGGRMELNTIIILYSLHSTLYSLLYPLRSTHYLTLGANYFTLYPLLSSSPSPPNMVYKCRTKGIVEAGKTPYLCTQKKYQR